MNIDNIKEKLEYDFKTVKDFDPVEYCGGEMWKPHRKFSNFNLTAKDLGISQKMFQDFRNFQESAWAFCDTIILENHAEYGYHILDYALHGERMNWKVGDEYWLVINCACNKSRLELRKADPNKWTPLEKFYVNKHLDIRLKIYALPSLYSLIFSNRKRSLRKKIIKQLGINSYPDRIELFVRDENSVADIINYYARYSSFKYKENNFYLNEYFFNLISNEKYHLELQNYAKIYGFNRYYKLFNENDKNENPEIYKNIFVKYCHDLHYRQKHLKEFE